MKKLIISLLVIFVLGVTLFIFIRLSQPPSTSPNTTGTPVNTFPNSTGTNNPTPTPMAQTGAPISIATANNSSMQVRNFLQDPAVVPDKVNPGQYYVGPHRQADGVTDPTATQNPPFAIHYIQSTGYFNVALLQEPLRVTRQQAEQYLMSQLGISQSQMCQLSYMVSTPSSVNDLYAGESLGFSFCPGAVQLP